MARGCIALMAKAPVLGQVKTRLAAELGQPQALKAYQAMLRQAAHTLQQLKECERQLFAALDSHHPYLQNLAAAHNLLLQPQPPGDLGERMLAIVQMLLTEHPWAILIGADCPAMDAAYLRHAIAALQQGSEVVLGPSEDGGYVLIGMTRVHAVLFHDMPWSTPQVLPQTLDRIARRGLTATCLEPLWDVDEAGDYWRWLDGSDFG